MPLSRKILHVCLHARCFCCLFFFDLFISCQPKGLIKYTHFFVGGSNISHRIDATDAAVARDRVLLEQIRDVYERVPVTEIKDFTFYRRRRKKTQSSTWTVAAYYPLIDARAACYGVCIDTLMIGRVLSTTERYVQGVSRRPSKDYRQLITACHGKRFPCRGLSTSTSARWEPVADTFSYHLDDTTGYSNGGYKWGHSCMRNLLYRLQLTVAATIGSISDDISSTAERALNQCANHADIADRSDVSAALQFYYYSCPWCISYHTLKTNASRLLAPTAIPLNIVVFTGSIYLDLCFGII